MIQPQPVVLLPSQPGHVSPCAVASPRSPPSLAHAPFVPAVTGPPAYPQLCPYGPGVSGHLVSGACYLARASPQPPAAPSAINSRPLGQPVGAFTTFCFSPSLVPPHLRPVPHAPLSICLFLPFLHPNALPLCALPHVPPCLVSLCALWCLSLPPPAPSTLVWGLGTCLCPCIRLSRPPCPPVSPPPPCLTSLPLPNPPSLTRSLSPFLPVLFCSHCIHQILESVTYIHHYAIVHRDLKVSIHLSPFLSQRRAWGCRCCPGWGPLGVPPQPVPRSLPPATSRWWWGVGQRQHPGIWCGGIFLWNARLSLHAGLPSTPGARQGRQG